ncbi:flavin-binding monooxygenase-like domain-containing protein [Hirsutella rhossiliensis]|uniref:Flavin-binding monooxygenase-like domain-containing protein n=1 Tax=Hirsutella rhossiliensis TaxID=111463 RepID=A0A9P8MMG9_9HYPO|nr:flavin-binding monooxygenase-like domain-containing protein [Hirsutella rhossiliensis]KAH0958058.1 flavin-binding monooxygenase-like domain-containing protein [Hirsutella rhossiliensis]
MSQGQESHQAASYSQFACIGCGFSAVALGATLKRWYGITDICFFERQGNVGGVWFANKYPGCASDVPSALYCLSFSPNSHWSNFLAPHDELCQYISRVADEYGLLQKMRFNAAVERCEWIEEKRRWRMQICDGETGDILIHESHFLFSAAGQLVYPREPDLPGIESFRGPVFHASRWRHDIDLCNKNVVLVGNGCTATQIVPAIRDQARRVTQFMRSKHWILPGFKMSARVTSLVQFLCRYVPGFFYLFRFLAFLATENDMRAIYMTLAAAAFRRSTSSLAKCYIKSAAPAEYHDLLVPDFELGCKRTILDDTGYMESLHADNVELTDDPILEVLPHGVRSRNGFTKADVIVLATGFETNQFLTGINVIGRHGKTVTEHWEAFGGPGAYNTTCLNGFPNFFMILGPNTGSGATSALLASENTINYSLRIIKPIIDGDAITVDVNRGAEELYIHQIQEDLQRTVWSAGCSSWYNRGSKARNAMNYPFSQLHFWYRCLFPVYADFTYEVSFQTLGPCDTFVVG